MTTKWYNEANKRCRAGSQAGGHRAAGRQTDRQTVRRGSSYLLNLLVAGRHGRENATKFKRQEKKFRASKIIEEDPETWENKIIN